MFVEQPEPCDSEYKCSYKDRADPCTDNIQNMDVDDQGARRYNFYDSRFQFARIMFCLEGTEPSSIIYCLLHYQSCLWVMELHDPAVWLLKL